MTFCFVLFCFVDIIYSNFCTKTRRQRSAVFVRLVAMLRTTILFFCESPALLTFFASYVFSNFFHRRFEAHATLGCSFLFVVLSFALILLCVAT